MKATKKWCSLIMFALLFTMSSMLHAGDKTPDTKAGPSHITECANSPDENDRKCVRKSNGHGFECKTNSKCDGWFSNTCDCYKTIPKS